MAPLLCPIEIRRVRRVGSPHGTGSGNKSRLVAFESTRLEQRRGMLTFDEIMKFVVTTRRIFPIDIGCVRRFASRRVAETGSRNRWPLVATEVF